MPPLKRPDTVHVFSTATKVIHSFIYIQGNREPVPISRYPEGMQVYHRDIERQITIHNTLTYT